MASKPKINRSKITNVAGQEKSFAESAKALGIAISAVKYDDPNTLQANKENQHFFKKESPEYFEILKKDIKDRGIIVPLIAKKNGVLLAGHNRLIVALELNLDAVPVQYIESDLTTEQETHFLLKDNVLRRQLTPEQRREMLVKIYGDQLFEERRGGDRTEAKVTTSPLPMAEQISKDFGVSEAVAKKDLAAIRKGRGEAKKNHRPKPKPFEIAAGKMAAIESICKKHPADISKILAALKRLQKDIEKIKEQKLKNKDPNQTSLVD